MNFVTQSYCYILHTMEYLTELYFIHSDFPLAPLLTKVFYTESQKFLLQLHQKKFDAFREKLHWITQHLKIISPPCYVFTKKNGQEDR